LHRTRRDQDRGVGRQRTGKRRCGEKRKARHEDAFCAEPVAQRAGGEDQRRKCNRVGADHPLQLGNASAEGIPDRTQGRVDDRHVELDDAVTKAHRGERQRLRESRAVFGWHQCADIRGRAANNAERFARDRSVLRTSCPSAMVARVWAVGEEL
jgi:hypothetical protein